MSRKLSIFLVLAVLAAFLGYAAWKVLLAPSDLPPEGFARGNGRIEADLIDISTRLTGRVAEITVREGDLVQPGDMLGGHGHERAGGTADAGASRRSQCRSGRDGGRGRRDRRPRRNWRWRKANWPAPKR